jgi:hypothetical protein
MKLHRIFSLAVILLAYSYQGASAQESRGPACPVISVSQIGSASTGSTIIYKVTIQNGDPLVTPKFNWTVSAGKITGGQDTAQVSVEGNDTITVTVEVIGFAANCPNKASYSSIVERMPLSRKFDEYHYLKFTEERRRLDQFATALRNEPGSAGYIIVHDLSDARRPSARERGERAKNYLVKKHDLPEARIVVVNSGHRDERSIELFITTVGALPPE